ncbi:MAG: general secretion pathway protein GspD [Bacteroidota bacterium]|nr:general secretion pathway protein GspD [Bacteroidota bacterium]
MKSPIRLIAFAFIILLTTSFGSPEDDVRIDQLGKKLNELAVSVPGLNNKVELSVNGLPIQEFIRGLAVTNNLNVSVEPALDTKLYDNFTNVTVSDVFLFLCRRYELNITFIGNIMVFSKYIPPAPAVLPYSPKLPVISWNEGKEEISFDLQNDSLALVARELTRKTGKNIVFAPELIGKKVNGYIQNQNLKAALDKLAFANDLKITSTEGDFYLVEPALKTGNPQNNAANGNQPKGLPQGVKLNTDNGLITLDAVNAPIGELIAVISSALKKQYFLFADIKGTTTLSVKDVTYDQFLVDVFNGTEFTYRKNADTYFVGDRNLEGLRVTHVVKMQYRTVEKVIDYIPADFKKGVDIKTFPDLNSLILSGSEPRIAEIESFLRQIDQVVPVVMIEVIIIDYSKSHTVAAGIQAGLGTPPPNNGTITPNIDITANGDAINNLISGLNGFGFLNLGYITPDFYLHLTALEDNGVLDIHSTPKLATLNGNEAKMSIGRTEYYLEQTTNIIGSQNPQTQITTTYKPLNADLAISITPMVSGDEQVTMNISVKQSTFTKRVSDTGPFGTTQRSFESVVRVKNQQMILLGGLEEDVDNESGKGVPLLSRLPFFKWIFGLHTKTKAKTRLSVLIRPTVIY